MIACALMLLLSGVVTDVRLQKIIVDLLHPSSMESVEIDSIPQPYFEDLTFFKVDTGRIYVDSEGSHYVHPIHRYESIRIAVDADGRVYKLFGLDTLEFDKLIHRYPVSGVDLDIVNVHDYGRFYIEMTMISSLRGDFYFVEGLHSFVDFNRKLMLDEYSRFIGKRLEELESRMSELAPRLNFDLIRFDRSVRSYIVDYYIWFYGSGNLRHVSLRIDVDGACSVATDEILAERLGAYDSIRKAFFPPSDDSLK